MTSKSLLSFPSLLSLPPLLSLLSLLSLYSHASLLPRRRRQPNRFPAGEERLEDVSGEREQAGHPAQRPQHIGRSGVTAAFGAYIEVGHGLAHHDARGKAPQQVTERDAEDDFQHDHITRPFLRRPLPSCAP